MKYLRSREQFIGEAVEVKTNRYQRTHGKKPKGFGQWAFYFDDMGGEPIFVPKAMNYSDAVKWAKGEAKKAGKREIYVGESVTEAASDRFLQSAAYNLAKQMRGKSASRATLMNRLNSMPLASRLKQDELDKIIDYTMKEMGLSEGEVLLFDELNNSFDDLSTKISKLMDRTDDPKWNKALQGMMNQLEKLISFAAKHDTRLGVIPVDEAKSPVKIGDVLTHPDGRKGKVVKIMSDMANVDFGKGDVYGIMFRRIKGNQITENYDTEQRKEMASKGLALPDGSFPIKTVEDLKNAIQAYGRAKDQAKAAKFIAKRAKALNAEDLIPDTEDFQKALKEAEFGRIPKFGE